MESKTLTRRGTCKSVEPTQRSLIQLILKCSCSSAVAADLALMLFVICIEACRTATPAGKQNQNEMLRRKVLKISRPV